MANGNVLAQFKKKEKKLEEQPVVTWQDNVGGKEATPAFTADEKLTPAPVTNVFQRKEPTAPQPDSHSAMWGQKVFGNMPLDMFVKTMGAAAHAVAPEEMGGRLGKSMAQMGEQAYAERMRREYEGPNVLLRRKLGEQALTKGEIEIERAKAEAPKLWTAVYNDAKKAGLSDFEAANVFYRMQQSPTKPAYHYVKGKNEIAMFKDGAYTGSVKLDKETGEKLKSIVYLQSGDAMLVDEYGNEIKKISDVRVPGGAKGHKDVIYQTSEGFPVIYNPNERKFQVQETKEDGSVKLRDATPDETRDLRKIGTDENFAFMQYIKEFGDKETDNKETGKKPKEEWENYY